MGSVPGVEDQGAFFEDEIGCFNLTSRNGRLQAVFSQQADWQAGPFFEAAPTLITRPGPYSRRRQFKGPWLRVAMSGFRHAKIFRGSSLRSANPLHQARHLDPEKWDDDWCQNKHRIVPSATIVFHHEEFARRQKYVKARLTCGPAADAASTTARPRLVVKSSKHSPPTLSSCCFEVEGACCCDTSKSTLGSGRS